MLNTLRSDPQIEAEALRSAPDAPPRPALLARPHVRGKFLFAGGEKLYVRGVTYGTFRPDAHGHEYPDPLVVERDFADMAAHAVNAVRVYTMPPTWVLDVAARHGLRLLVSLAVERVIGHLADGRPPRDLEARLRNLVRMVAGHPAILAYAIGNEIPAATVRWLGAARVERYLGRIARLIKRADPMGLVTYANYPSTEYLELPFLDFCCFNVYLETPDTFEAYVARLQNVVGDRPLVMSEVGLDSLRHSEPLQAHVLGWQLDASFRGGCAGAFVYAWTDEWHRGGEDVDDWAFGLVRRDRTPKIALSHVRVVFRDTPFPPGDGSSTRHDRRWPSFTIVVCSHNGNHCIRDCFDALVRLDYPAFEIVVVDDGSTDGTGATAQKYGFHVVRTSQGGLGHARNLGLRAARGEIVAYIDDDAYPDPHWLHYLATAFEGSDFVGVGGPNLVPSEDGPIAHCVANTPGGPIHVLTSDREAEHIPGCNMAFRREALEAIGGFDPQFWTAGDDVDVCWRLQEQGWSLGFSPAAVVWHHRRASVQAFWKQQRGYGKAEALLEAKWPAKYNLAGHATWFGRIYDPTPSPLLGGGPRVYYGVWGSAPFQFLRHPVASGLQYLPHIPEWHLVNVTLALVALTSLLWPPLVWTVPLLVCAVAFPLVQAVRGAICARFTGRVLSGPEEIRLRAVTGFLHVTQPLARLYGRIRFGLAPWRLRSGLRGRFPWRRTIRFWTDQWQASETRLRTIQDRLRAASHFVVTGGEHDAWDLEARGGFLGGARLLCAVEEHGHGCQTVRIRVWPRLSVTGLMMVGLLGGLAWAASRDHAWGASALLGSVAMLLAVRMTIEAATALSSLVYGARPDQN